MSYYSTITDIPTSEIKSDFIESFGGFNGFEELKRYIKQGSEFSREVAAVIHERAELEVTYSKGLSKIASKLMKSIQSGIGSLVAGWKGVATSMETEAEVHKNLAASLLDDIARPLKQLVEGQHKARKPIEAAVDKSLRTLTEKRVEENKAKKGAYDCAKTYEKAEEGKQGKPKTEKDVYKNEKMVKKLLDSLCKADKLYCECSEKAEVARQEWDLSANQASIHLQIIEEERLSNMNTFLDLYSNHILSLAPKLTESCEKLKHAVQSVDICNDIKVVCRQHGTGHYSPEQILIDCYAEDKQFTFRRERRKQALQRYLLHLRKSIEREQKGREGIEKLVEVYKESPSFADAEAQEETQQRLLQVIYMTNFLETNHYKIAAALADLDSSIKPSHPFSKYIEQSRDKQGLLVSSLKLPMTLAIEGKSGYDATSVTLGALATDEPFLDDEYYEDFEETEFRIIGRCKALFEFKSENSDELILHPGVIINLYEKQPDGWWKGELNGQIGMFPASYVQML